MTASDLSRRLMHLGHRLRLWRCGVLLRGWGGSLLVLWAVGGLADYLFQLRRPGRLYWWLVLTVGVVELVRRIVLLVRRRQTLESVASQVESAYPALDNRLINTIQFTAQSEADPFRDAYLAEGVPDGPWVDGEAMRDRRAGRRAWRLLWAGALVALVPLFIWPNGWRTCLARVGNPFSDRAPVSATRLVEVAPGNTVVAQGSDLALSCRVEGRARHTIALDVRAEGMPRSVFELGTVGDSTGLVSYVVSKVTTPLRYRFRAGDAPNPRWYRVETRPPLGFSQVEVLVKPPAYTRLKPRRFDALSEAVEVPEQSTVEVFAICNFDLKEASARWEGVSESDVAMRRGEASQWMVGMTHDKSDILVLQAESLNGETTRLDVVLSPLPDQPPVIAVAAPQGRTVLGPRGIPSIQFSVGDDYGLSEVWIEKRELGESSSREESVSRWDEKTRRFRQFWRDAAQRPVPGRPAAFYIMARDGRPGGGRTSRSAPIVFETVGGAQAAGIEAAQHAKAASVLDMMIEWQRENLSDSDILRKQDGGVLSGWNPVIARQKRIREAAGELLDDAHRPLGGMTPMLEGLYREEMQQAISALEAIPRRDDAARRPQIVAALKLQETILRKLTYADVAADRTHRERVASGLLAMLQSLVKKQATLIAETGEADKKTPDSVSLESLTDRQDQLAGEVGDFVAACRREAPVLEPNDKAFAAIVRAVAERCESERIRADMLRAAEQLENGQPAQALPHQDQALVKLKAVLEMLGRAQAEQAVERRDELRDALADAKDRVGTLRDMQTKLAEAMRLTELQEDRASEETDLLEEEIEEMQENIREALLQIPRDLHIYPELSVANELIEDVYSVYEEVMQVPGTEALTGESVTEIGVLKPDALLEAMDEAEGRLDDMEMWLGDKPDSIQFNMEPFDREEMPMMALGELPTSMEDLISDLLEESESLAAEAEDSATNLGMSDFPPGWEVAEGPIESFGAQGKSGNQTPDHKEQSGRSIVGREGQSVGETAAGTGTISEGDKNIEKRITPEPLQSGQVQADGEAAENATGGGKQSSGHAEELGMAGAGANRRMDSPDGDSLEGLKALMERTQAATVQASLMNLRTESLSDAAHHLRQADDAIAKGRPIVEIKEFQRRAVASLRRAQTELTAGIATTIETDDERMAPLEDSTATSASGAPEGYRGLVADYFKSLGESL